MGGKEEKGWWVVGYLYASVAPMKCCTWGQFRGVTESSTSMR